MVGTNLCVLKWDWQTRQGQVEMSQQNQEQGLIKVPTTREEWQQCSLQERQVRFFYIDICFGKNNLILTPSPQIDWAYLSLTKSKDCPFAGQRGISFPSHLIIY